MQKVLFISSVIPDDPMLITPAFSRAGNMCVNYLLSGMKRSGVLVDKLLSAYPVPSFPTTKQLYFPKSRCQLNNELNIDTLSFINVSPIKQLSLGISSYFEIVKWGRNAGPGDKIIFTFNISVPPGIFLLKAARRIGARVVAMIYDINVPGETVPRTLPFIIDYWQHQKTLRYYDGLVVITKEIALDFAPYVPYICVEGGIGSDLVEQYRTLEKTTMRDSDHFVIVAAGGLKEVNGIREILSAFCLLNGDEYSLHIAGSGPLEGLVKDAVEKDPRITFHGFLPFDEVLKLYAEADVLVNMRLTHRVNTRYFFPSKTMEYLASGVPVITTCPGGMAEEYGTFSYLLHEETPAALADMIKTIAAMPVEQRVARGKAARQYMMENKTWDAQSKRIAAFLGEMI
jgi:glycosyltransferase involved in cell wall biosynthesis